MGTVMVTIGVGDPQGQRFENLEVVVDTGATFSTVPRTLLEQLGVPVERSAPSELADGSVVPVDVGRTIIRLEEKEFPTPVIFGEPAEPSLLGVIALEDALLAVDPVARRLTPVNLLRLIPIRFTYDTKEASGTNSGVHHIEQLNPHGIHQI